MRGARISLLRSSSIHLAIIFTLLLCTALVLFYRELRVAGASADMATLSLYAIITLLLMIAAGMFGLSYYVTKRINTIIKTAETIVQTGDLSARIPIDNPWDDLSTLSATLNTMICRIEESVEAIRTVSDNIAHDLRTPLTRLRNRIERLHEAPCNAADQPEHMQKLLNECDGLLATFQALLRISRVETAQRKDHFSNLSLAALLHDVIELYEPLAAEKNISIHPELSDISIIADADLLFQCFANILDNAIKYTPAHGSICLSSAQERNTAIIRIADSGAGVPDALKERLFTRFFRADGPRNTSGNGLGLALVAAIIKLHHGTIALLDHTPTGLCVQVAIPLPNAALANHSQY